MLIKIQHMDMAYSEPTIEQGAQAVADRFGVAVEVTKTHGGGGGWPEVSITGTPAQILAMFVEDGGWATGDKEEDAEQVFYAMRSAVEVYAPSKP